MTFREKHHVQLLLRLEWLKRRRERALAALESIDEKMRDTLRQIAINESYDNT